jgi:putative oxidoreductase
MPMLDRISSTRAPATTLLVRILVGAVFLCEGLLKFTLPDELGAGRFAHIGIPAPKIMGPFVGVVEVVAGCLLLVGFLTRPAALALLINISVAIISTKIPILLGHGIWLFSLPKATHYGFWGLAHEARTDLCMWLGCLFLLIVGAGCASIDAAITGRRTPAEEAKTDG